MRGSHLVVVPALAIVTASGILMAMADWTTFVSSSLFWLKMAAFALLIVNGAMLVSAERSFAKEAQPQFWRRLVITSGASFLLWLVTLWLGEWLTLAA